MISISNNLPLQHHQQLGMIPETNMSQLNNSNNNNMNMAMMEMEMMGPELSLKELLSDQMTNLNLNGSGGGMGGGGLDNYDPLTLEIEKERVEYLEKSKHLQEQLRDLKKEIEGLKLEEKQTPYDMIHAEQVMSGENKYSTLRKVKFLFILIKESCFI